MSVNVLDATFIYTLSLSPCSFLSLTHMHTHTLVFTPIIVIQPESMDGVFPNSNVTFAVIAMGGDLSYQWSRNGSEISGAAQAILTLVGVTVERHEGIYSCFISNRAGNVTTDNVSLTVCKYMYSALGQYIDKILLRYCASIAN